MDTGHAGDVRNPPAAHRERHRSGGVRPLRRTRDRRRSAPAALPHAPGQPAHLSGTARRPAQQFGITMKTATAALQTMELGAAAGFEDATDGDLIRLLVDENAAEARQPAADGDSEGVAG